MRQLKVYGLTMTPQPEWKAETRQVRVIVAATSRQKAAAALRAAGLNITSTFLGNYGGESGNPVEFEAAVPYPETVFWANESGRRSTASYKKVAE